MRSSGREETDRKENNDMTYEELVAKAREVYGKADASGIKGHVAYQFNITGEGEGAFYLEIDNGVIKIEPYEYFDRDVLFTMTAKNLIKIGLGELDPVWAFTTGRLKLEGSIDKALLLKDLAGSVKEQLKKESAPAEVTATECAGDVKPDAEHDADSGDDAGETADNASPAETTEPAVDDAASAGGASSADNAESEDGTAPAETTEPADNTAAPNQTGASVGIRLPGQMSGGRGKKNRKKKRR